MCKSILICCLAAFILRPASAQTSLDVQAVLDRLDKLEDENHRLEDEIRDLRTQLLAAKTTPESAERQTERLDVQETRTADLDQTKVTASQRYPVSLTGMLLFNAFRNGNYSGTSEYPTSASSARAAASDGATLRQTIIGLNFKGPDLPWGGSEPLARFTWTSSPEAPRPTTIWCGSASPRSI